MTRKRKRYLLLSVVIAAILIVAGVRAFVHSDIYLFMKPFDVTIDNQSDLDLVSIEVGTLTTGDDGGVVEGASKTVFKKQVKGGTKATFKPDLELRGEGSIYLKFTDEQGHSYKKGICGYTESLSGHSDVTFLKDRTVKVVEKCY